MACGQADFHSLPLTARGFRWYTSPMDTTLHPVLSIRLFKDEKCFGPGIAQLLERVEEHRSLRAAAQSMEMAYSKAWTMVRRCESVLGFRLLNYATGGRGGGGAALTREARELLSRYRRYCRRLELAAAALFDEEFPAPTQEDPHGL